MSDRVDLGFEYGPNSDPIKMAIPFIFCNMGGEMVYILEQRLYSQKIRKDKIERVLDDIIRQMYNPRVFRELLRPGPLPSNTYMRGIFHTIANTSIMKLSDQSMEKMYELMVMGFKYQVLTIAHPKDLIAITLNHIESNRLLTHHNSHARQAIDTTLIQIEQAMAKITVPQYHTIRWLICKFFQDRRTKVSLFLRESLQTDRGYFPLQAGGPMPNDELVEMPGVVRYHSPGAPPVTEAFAHPLTLLITTQRKSNHFDYQTRDVRLGTNLYISQTEGQREAALDAIGRPEDAPPVPQSSPAETPAKDTDAPTTTGPDTPGRDDEAPCFSDANFLGAVLGTRNEEPCANGFKFSPLGEAAEEKEQVIEIQDMTREQFQTINSELVAMMDELEVLDKVYSGDKNDGSCSSLLDLLRGQGLA